MIAHLVWRCRYGLAPSYLRELYRHLSSCAAGRPKMRSSVQGNLTVSFVLFATMQSNSFSVVGPTTWNGLPSNLRHLPNGVCAQLHQILKTLFRLFWFERALSRDLEGALYNFLLTGGLIDQ